jgi:hypothetical protein
LGALQVLDLGTEARVVLAGELGVVSFHGIVGGLATELVPGEVGLKPGVDGLFATLLPDLGSLQEPRARLVLSCMEIDH